VTSEPPRPGGLAEVIERSGVCADGLPGEPATSVEYRVQAERTVALLAETLARLHRTDLGDDAATTALDAPALATQLVAAALDGPRADRPRSQAYRHIADDRLRDILVQGAPGVADRCDRMVLTHGRPTLASLWCERGEAVGFVGWNRAAVADPYRDLAVAAHSVATDMAPVLVPVLFDHYGEHAPDPIRLDWFSLAAELGTDPGAG
jgi:aminoglycoside phosphotransferase